MNDKYTVILKWTLVSDHLPESSGVYLATVKDVNRKGECNYYTDTMYFDYKFQRFEDITWENDDVVAWMKLPEPLEI